jgi:hypothetical protein
VAEPLAPGARVLYCGPDVDDIVAELRSAGVDAYGVSTAGTPYRPGPDVRHANLLDHLRAVATASLGAVVLIGVPDAMRPEALRPLIAELGRAARTVVVVSEAPWWWRQRLGPVQADLSPGRPLDPETWLDALHRVAMVGSAEYDTSGRSYRVVVRARE